MLDWLHKFFDQMPIDGSLFAPKVDWLNNFITYSAVFCTVAITAVMIYFMVRYRRRSDDDETDPITHNVSLEVIWTVIPTIIVLFVFFYGFTYYREMRTPPENPIEINVEGYRWGWNFEYENGKKASGEVMVPVGKPVRFIMRSRDVNHSFFIPAMRVKEDVIAGAYHYLWFTPTVEGEFPVFCAEYCGLNHSFMRATLKVVAEEVFNDFLEEKPEGPGEGITPVEWGRKLYQEKGCMGCHSLDGTSVVGPTFQHIMSHEVELEDGTKVPVDENYLRESILNPNAKIVKGFQPNLMPAFQGLVTEEELGALIAFIKTQK